jgi:hypothetical protein
MRQAFALVVWVMSVSFLFGADPPPPIAIMKHSWFVDSGNLRDLSALAVGDASVRVLPSNAPGSGTNAAAGLPRQKTMVAPPVNVDPPSEQPGTRDLFHYEVTLRNEAGKPIQKVFWSYVFINPETNEVISRHRFATDTKIKPGKSKKLTGFTYKPPSTFTSVSVMKRQPGWEKSERVEILRIQFSDGTFWSHRR